MSETALRFLAVDPSSSELGWVVMESDRVLDYGGISTKGIEYSERFSYIIRALEIIRKQYQPVEIITEGKLFHHKFNAAALDVVIQSIKEWAGANKLPYTAYSPGQWKKGAIGNYMADKEQVARIVYLVYPKLRQNLPDHVTDAIGIAMFHSKFADIVRRARGKKKDEKNKAKTSKR